MLRFVVKNRKIRDTLNCLTKENKKMKTKIIKMEWGREAGGGYRPRVERTMTLQRLTKYPVHIP